MDNGTRPNDYIDLSGYPSPETRPHKTRDAIRRLYGQPFDRAQLTQILIKEYQLLDSPELVESVRKYLYEMEKKGELEVIRRGHGSTRHIYREVKARDSGSLYSGSETSDAGKAPPSPKEKVGSNGEAVD